MNHSAPGLLAVSIFSLAPAAAVVVLGAWVRLSRAGLGRPDRPGCYGRLWGTADGPGEPAPAAAVVVLGAWVRLSRAGLGRPDRPGCYGRLWGTADGPGEPAPAAGVISNQKRWLKHSRLG